MQYLGDFAEDATIFIPFNTFSSDDPQASVTITNLADADIKVHKDGSTTEITTDGATIAINFDGITGNHLITIDSSVDAAYSTGSDYLVRIEGTTVDGGTINAFIGSFSIENRFQQGVAQTADHTDAIADIPTVAEFEARTLVAASYFDPTADAVANVTLVATTTALTNVINAASIVASVSGNVDGSVDSVTGDTKQTADHTAAIADIPTVSEFNARTLVAASYFDPAADTVANVTLVATTTTNTDMVAEAPTFSQIWTTQLTESYASDGTAPTPAQALFITMQNLQSFSFTGTTQTVRRINDSTTAATYTLDDATNPTSKERTT